MPENENNIFRNDSEDTISPDAANTSEYPASEAPAAPESTEAPVYESPFTSVEAEDKKKKKGKGKKIAIISGITAAVLVGGGVAAYNLSDFVKNQVNLLVMNPENYYSWVTEKNAAAYADKAAESYSDDISAFDNGSTTSIELKYDISDEAKNILIEKMQEEADTTDEELELLTDIINNTSDLSYSFNIQSKKTDAQLSVGSNINGISLLSLDMAVDLLNPKLFMRYPEMKKQWIGIDIMESIESGIENDDDQKIYDKIFAFYQGIISDPTAFINPEELEDAVNNYSAAWIKSISDVERERREKVSIGDITVKYTSLEVDIDAELAARLLRNFLKELSDDKVIRRAVIDRLDLVTEKEYEKAIDAAIDASKLINDESDETVSVKTYIDPIGTIRGISICGNDMEIFYALGKHKDNFAIEFSVTSDDTKMINLTLNAEEAGKETYEGCLSLELDEEFTALFTDEEESAEDYTITMDFEDMTIGSLDNIKLSGDAVLNIPDVDPISLKFKGKNKTQSITYNIKYDGTDYGDISLIFTTKDKSSFEIPDISDSYMVDVENSDSFNIYDYIGYDDLVDYITNMLITLGIDEDTAADIAEESMAESAYGNDYIYKEELDNII